MLTNSRDTFGVSQGHQTWYHSTYVRYSFLLVCYRNFVPKICTVFEIFDFKKVVTLKTGLGDRQGHGKCHYSIERYDNS